VSAAGSLPLLASSCCQVQAVPGRCRAPPFNPTQAPATVSHQLFFNTGSLIHNLVQVPSLHNLNFALLPRSPACTTQLAHSLSAYVQFCSGPLIPDKPRLPVLLSLRSISDAFIPPPPPGPLPAAEQLLLSVPAACETTTFKSDSGHMGRALTEAGIGC
jgi:hypothetical protein